jgi:hypothetical protein
MEVMKRKIPHQLLLDTRGFSIINLIMAMSLMSMMSLYFVEQAKTAAKITKNVNNSLDRAIISKQIEQKIIQPNCGGLALGEVSFDPNNIGNLILGADAKPGGFELEQKLLSKHKIKEFSFIGLEIIPATSTYSALLRVRFDADNNGTPPLKPIDLNVNIGIDQTTGALDSCLAVIKDEDVKKMCDSMGFNYNPNTANCAIENLKCLAGQQPNEDYNPEETDLTKIYAFIPCLPSVSGNQLVLNKTEHPALIQANIMALFNPNL